MELTQRLEGTQGSYEDYTEKVLPEQVGFLGICGQKYPIVNGPNKIGRDPQTCSIILNLNSISRQHAVLNVLNKTEFMLMDLDSANKTKVEKKTLDPYIPEPLKHGNTIQFGHVFGVFRLLEEDTDLPMTQCIDIPETPLKKNIPIINHTAYIPESPDVSDRDDSFIAPSQPNKYKPTGFIKSSVISINNIKKENVYWDSKKKSDLFELDENTNIKIQSVISLKENSIHGLETQDKQELENETKVSIFNDKTQMPEEQTSLSFFNMETQIPINDSLPSVCKINTETDVQIDLYTNKEMNNTIYNAETQFAEPKSPNNKFIEKEKSETVDTSDDIILFDEIDSQPLEEGFESQALLPSSPILVSKDSISPRKRSNYITELKYTQGDQSSDSTDCEDIDIIPSQKLPLKPDPIIDDQITDIDMLPTQIIETVSDLHIVPTPVNEIRDSFIKTKTSCDEDMTDCEDILEENDNKRVKTNSSNLPMEAGDNIEDLLTQVIEIAPESQAILKSKVEVNINSSFKVPMESPRKKRKKESLNSSLTKVNNKSKAFEDDSLYYAATQEILEDLCTQVDSSTNDRVGDNSSELVLNNLDRNSKKTIDNKMTKLRRFPSDGSDCEVTPNKMTPFKLINIDLPDSQEIRNSVMAQPKRILAESSSETESEKDSQDGTPILFKRKKRKTNDAKLDLLKKFDADSLPTRISKRIKKPTDKVIQSTYNSSKSTFYDQTDDVDTDIVQENILRLKNEKSKKHSNSLKHTNNKEIKRTSIKEKETSVQQCSKSRDKRTNDSKFLEKSTKSAEKKVNSNDKKETSRSKRAKTEHSDSVETNKSRFDTRQTRGIKQQVDSEKSQIKEIEPVRRSRRRKNVANDDSEVYSSSHSKESDLPSKMCRPATSLGVSTNLRTSTRKKKSQAIQHVLFTAFPADNKKTQLVKLGAVIAKDVKSCTVVVTMQIKRTFKLLCAVGLGKPIVGLQWVQACIDNNTIVEPWLYLIKDEATEERCRFRLHRTLVGPRNFLKGVYVSSTPSVTPCATEMKAIVQCSGGKWKEPSLDPPKSTWLVVSALADKALWPALQKKGAVVVSNELILGGVLKQVLEIEQNKLA